MLNENDHNYCKMVNWFLLVENIQLTMQIYHLVITLHILEIITVLKFCLIIICVKKVIHPPRLDNEQHMIIITLMVLLIQILTLSLHWLQLIDFYVIVYVFCMCMFIFHVYCIGLYVLCTILCMTNKK